MFSTFFWKQLKVFASNVRQIFNFFATRNNWSCIKFPCLGGVEEYFAIFPNIRAFYNPFCKCRFYMGATERMCRIHGSVLQNRP